MPITKQRRNDRADAIEELLIIDSDVASADILLTGLSRPMEIIQVTADGDPIAQIARALSCHFGVQHLHIVSHGEPGALILGGIRVDSAHLQTCRDALSTIQFSLGRPAAISLWASFVSTGTVGRKFITELADNTGADIFATDRAIGAKQIGGSWDIGPNSPFLRSTETSCPHIIPRLASSFT